eukprot:4860707-Amphidinium_carterae.2
MADGSEPAAVDGPKAPVFDRDFEEREDGTIIWNASLVLLHYLQAPERSPRGKRVLELGSGLGHLGYGLAKLGAHVTCTDLAKCIGDLEKSLEQLQRDSGTAESFGGSIRAMAMSWGEEGFQASTLAAEVDAP